MKDVMVSIRMPSSLANELKSLVKKLHFLDLSELTRSIVRKKWMQHAKPELFEIKKLGREIQTEIKKKSVEKVQDQVKAELEKIKEKLKKEGFYE